MKINPSKILGRQKKIYRALLVGGVFIILGICYLMLRTPQAPTPLYSQPKMDLPADKISPQDIWMNRIDAQNQVLEKRLQFLEEMLLEKKAKEEAVEQEKLALKRELHLLKQQIERPSADEPTEELFTPVANVEAMPVVFTPLTEACMPSLNEEKVRHVDQVIPSGTTVKAILLSSVDADCSVYSSSDTIPVKLRIVDDGHLPKGVDVALKGGVIIGSAYGNISSERVYIRLERLTQIKPSGNFVETEVTGFVTGEDGKYGVRGTVVDKSGKIISTAAVSSAFSQAGSALQAFLGRYTIDNYLTTNQYTVDSSNSPGSFPRATSSFDMLADYYIRRAEQINPVIQVNAGRTVDITFTYGTEVGDLHTHNKVQRVRLAHQEER